MTFVYFILYDLHLCRYCKTGFHRPARDSWHDFFRKRDRAFCDEDQASFGEGERDLCRTLFGMKIDATCLLRFADSLM